jgi:hypothetical protein
VIKVLKEGEKTSKFKPGASEEMALLIVAAIEGIGLQAVMDPENIPVEKAVSRLKDLFRRAIKG